MNTNSESLVAEKRKALMSYFEDRTNNEKLAQLINKPEMVLADLDIEVGPQLKKAVSIGLKQAFQTYSKSNSVLKTEGMISMDEAMPEMDNSEQEGIHLSVQPWGLVLELDASATNKVVNGINITAGISAVIAAVAAVTEVGAPVSLVAGIFSGFCVVYASTIAAINNGNGVYLTVTWPQIALALIVPPVPVPTPR